jgi:hypothetical protein
MLGVSHDYAAACWWLFHLSGNSLFMFMYKKESGVSGLTANDDIWLSLFQGPSFMLLPLKIDHVSFLQHHCLDQYSLKTLKWFLTFVLIYQEYILDTHLI